MNRMFELDEVDLKVLDVLKNNSRLPNRQIAKKTGIPLATVNRRMKKLITNRIIKRFTTELDYEVLGKTTTAFVLVRCNANANYHEIYRKATANPAVEDMAPTAGQFDIIMKIRVRDNNELSDFLYGFVRSLPSVAQTETLITLNPRKE